MIYFQIINDSNESERTILLIDRMLQMTNALQRITQYYFSQTQMVPSNMLSLSNKFNEGCEEIIRLLQAIKNKLRYNYCICNTHNSC